MAKTICCLETYQSKREQIKNAYLTRELLQMQSWAKEMIFLTLRLKIMQLVQGCKCASMLNWATLILNCVNMWLYLDLFLFA
jgi:hypothetical protein